MKSCAFRAAKALGKIGAAANGAHVALTKACRDRNATVRLSAAEAAWQVSGDAKAAVPALVFVLRVRNEETRVLAAEVLSKMGARARPAVPALKEMVKSAKSLARLAAADALWHVDPAANEVFGVVVGALGGTDREADYASDILASMGPRARPAVPALTTALQSQNERMRLAAARALGTIGPAASPAAGALRGLLKVGDCEVRLSTAEALWRITRRGDDIIPVFIERLGSSDKDTCVRAAELLGEIGPSAKASVPALRRLVQQKGDVGEAAAAAIKRITAS